MASGVRLQVSRRRSQHDRELGGGQRRPRAATQPALGELRQVGLPAGTGVVTPASQSNSARHRQRRAGAPATVRRASRTARTSLPRVQRGAARRPGQHGERAAQRGEQRRARRVRALPRRSNRRKTTAAARPSTCSARRPLQSLPGCRRPPVATLRLADRGARRQPASGNAQPASAPPAQAAPRRASDAVDHGSTRRRFERLLQRLVFGVGTQAFAPDFSARVALAHAPEHFAQVGGDLRVGLVPCRRLQDAQRPRPCCPCGTRPSPGCR